ncbi:rosmarinate synthase [Phtheirospermum japonicum]|uniref:Rosmarinate synthase n=1 Tax=Phtheirospermum japonicum TaxID=374723 RepID=A0A830BUU2_9LAMI|nr:rosmarinate synthase [Phtheirospermum japonicum]
MKIKVTNSTVIKPTTATPITNLWISSLDALMPTNYHTRTLYFYRSTGGPNFFDVTVLKAALSRALVEFYPVAGRLKMDKNGRIEIDCNGKGVLFVEGEADGDMDVLGDFGPKPELSLIPTVDYSKGIGSYPLFLLQIHTSIPR